MRMHRQFNDYVSVFRRFAIPDDGPLPILRYDFAQVDTGYVRDCRQPRQNVGSLEAVGQSLILPTLSLRIAIHVRLHDGGQSG